MEFMVASAPVFVQFVAALDAGRQNSRSQDEQI
jgi:hypothetical protein